MPNIYHVSGGGGDVLNKLLSTNIGDGSIVYVGPGVYDGVKSFRWQNARLSVIGTHRDECILEAKYSQLYGSDLSAAVFWGGRIDQAWWANFTFKNGLIDRRNQVSGSVIELFGGIMGIYSATLSNCNIFDCSCIVSSATGSNDPAIMLKNTNFYGCHLSNIYYNGSNIIQNCSFYNCEINDIKDNISGISNYSNNNIYNEWLQGNRNYLHDNNIARSNLHNGNRLVFGSIIANNRGGSGNKFFPQYANTVAAVNCLFINNSNFSNMGSYSAHYKNCVFAGNTFTGANINWYRTENNGTSAKNLVVVNNVYDVPLTAIANIQNAISNTGVEGKYTVVSGNIFGLQLSDCGFIDPDHGNFRLRHDSPLISAGTCFSDFTYANSGTKTNPLGQKDLDGNYFHNPPSIGAYQYQFQKNNNMPTRLMPLGGGLINLYTQRLQYLESPTRKVGYIQPYIDTLTIPKVGMSFAGKFRCGEAYNTADRSVFLGNSWANRQVLCRINHETHAMEVAYCSWWTVSATNDLGVSDQYVNGTVFNFNAKLTESNLSVTFVNNNTSIVNKAVTPQYWTNGQKYKSGTIQQNSFLIFATRQTNGTQPYFPTQQRGYRFYWLKIWDESDNLIRDFIPVRIGSRSTGYGCLYDRVSRKLFLNENINQGVASTPFVMGPDGP